MLHLAFNFLNVCHIEREIFVSSIKQNRGITISNKLYYTNKMYTLERANIEK